MIWNIWLKYYCNTSIYSKKLKQYPYHKSNDLKNSTNIQNISCISIYSYFNTLLWSNFSQQKFLRTFPFSFCFRPFRQLTAQYVSRIILFSHFAKSSLLPFLLDKRCYPNKRPFILQRVSFFELNKSSFTRRNTINFYSMYRDC